MVLEIKKKICSAKIMINIGDKDVHEIHQCKKQSSSSLHRYTSFYLIKNLRELIISMKKYKAKKGTLKICIKNSSSIIFYNSSTVPEPELLVLFALINS